MVELIFFHKKIKPSNTPLNSHAKYGCKEKEKIFTKNDYSSFIGFYLKKKALPYFKDSANSFLLFYQKQNCWYIIRYFSQKV